MKKILLLLSIPILLLFLSCNGLLWTGQSQDIGTSLTINIPNPFPESSSDSSGRALALQGRYLYMELALVNTGATYIGPAVPLSADIAGGDWHETDWGGYAIVALDLSSLGSVTSINATFTNVPRDNDLSARVILEESSTVFNSNFPTYGTVYPLCQTYNEGGTGLWGEFGVVVTVADLESNAINLPIRPKTLETLFWGSPYINDDYISASQTAPGLGSTRFFLIEPDLASIQVRDIAYFSSVSGTVLANGSPPTSISLLYDGDGTPIGSAAPTYTGSGPFYCRFFQMQRESLPDYTNLEYFFGTTLLLTPSLPWNICFGILYDSNMESYEVSGISVDWTLPAGLIPGDLEFKILHIDNTVITNADLDTIDKINAYTFAYESYIPGV